MNEPSDAPAPGSTPAMKPMIVDRPIAPAVRRSIATGGVTQVEGAAGGGRGIFNATR